MKTGPFDDVYLTLVTTPDRPEGTAVIGVNVQPLVVWLWIGGMVMALGTVLAAWPGRRRPGPEPPAPVVGAVAPPVHQPAGVAL